MPCMPYPFALNISASSRASPSQMTFSISVSSSSARRPCASVSLTHITFSVKRLTLSRMMRMDFLGSRIVLDAAEGECDTRLPGSLIGGGVGRKVAGAPRHHVRIQRFCNKKAPPVAACSHASLVADIVDAVNIESVGVEMLTDLPTADIRRDGLVTSLIRARIGIIFEILAEDSFRNRFFHRCIPAVLPEGYVYGDQRRLAANGADADVIRY